MHIEFAVHDVRAVSVAYTDPAGGWTYAFLERLRIASTVDTFDGLDGTWNSVRTATNSSTLYDGSDLGGTIGAGNAPGGAALGTDGAINFLRIQDAGDPNDPLGLAMADPTNRKIYFAHNIGTDAGVTQRRDDRQRGHAFISSAPLDHGRHRCDVL